MSLSSRQIRVVAVAAIALVVMLALAAALLALQADAAVARIADALKPGYDVTYASPRVGFDGDLSVRELRVRASGDDRATLTAQRAVLRPPGAEWFLRAAFGSGETLPPIDRLSLTLEGVAVEGGGELHPAVRWIGTRSAAPFEGAGCGSSLRFGAEDWEKLGIEAGVATIDAGYAVTGPGLATVTANFAIPGSSRVEHRRVLKLDDPLHPLAADRASVATVESQWAVVDDGFIAARNRLCARRARVARNRFADVHVAAVRDWLRRFGLEASPELVDSYRRYALAGGELRMDSRPRAPIAFAAWNAAAPVERARALGASLTVTGKAPVPFALVAATVPSESADASAAPAVEAIPGPSPIADATTGGVTPGEPATASAPAPVSQPTTQAPPIQAPPIQAPPIQAPPIATPQTTAPLTTTAPAKTTPAKPAPIETPRPDTTVAATTASTSPARSDTEPSAEAAAGAPIQPTAPRTSVSAPPPPPPSPAPAPASKPADPVPAAKPTAVAAAPAKRPATKLRTGVATYEALEQAVDRRIAVQTVNDTRRLGVLRAWTGAAVTLELSGRDGNMQLKIPKDEIVRAEILDTAAVPRRDHAQKN